MSYKMSQILAPDGNPVAVTDGNRDGSRTIQIGDSLFSFGGWKADPVSTSLNDVYRSSGDLSLWEKMPDAPWSGRHTFGLEKLSDKFYLFGGDAVGNPVFDMWLTYDGSLWYPVSLPSPLEDSRVLYGSCSDGVYIYVIGGYDNINNFRSPLTSNVWRYDGNIWEYMGNGIAAFERNLSGAACCYNGKIYVISGGYYHKGGTKEMYSSDDFGANWRRAADIPFDGRQYHSTIVWDDMLWVIAGTDNTANESNGNRSDIWCLHTGARGLNPKWWNFPTPTEFKPRHAAAVAVYNDSIVITNGNYFNDGFLIEKI
jgi:N-acetylneuraminic acid mutarotase